jgi:di/tricarboxylate transporter
MKPENSNSNDARLGALLREARMAPSLPPRFREGVWRRIEESETPATVRTGWLDALAAWVLRPRFALATAVVLICAGSVFGVVQGKQANQENAQSRYVASVAPNSLR